MGVGALGGAAALEERARRVARTLAPAALILLFQMLVFPIPAGSPCGACSSVSSPRW